MVGVAGGEVENDARSTELCRGPGPLSQGVDIPVELVPPGLALAVGLLLRPPGPLPLLPPAAAVAPRNAPGPGTEGLKPGM